MSSEGKNILIIDDEQDVIDMLSVSLSRAGWCVRSATDGLLGLTMARHDPPALIVLDLMMPKMSGFEVCKLLRADPETQTIPIIILTAKAEEVDRVLGLEVGADDYVTKPFSPRELCLRINAILRRGAPVNDLQPLTVGSISVDPDRHYVSTGGKPIQLTAVEFRLLMILMRRPGRVQPRERLLRDVWGYEHIVETRTVDTHVRRLRDKLGKSANLLETVRGFGYRLRES